METLNETSRQRQKKKAAQLSGREVAVLRLVARGLSNPQIASHLHVAEATIKRHLANAYLKMKVHSRMQATAKALVEGWITAPDLREEADSVREAPVRQATRYRCVADGCGCEIIVVRAPKTPSSRPPFKCHELDMEPVSL
jgi:DNA-binding CsgD family transcriptional regulator